MKRNFIEKTQTLSKPTMVKPSQVLVKRSLPSLIIVVLLMIIGTLVVYNEPANSPYMLPSSAPTGALRLWGTLRPVNQASYFPDELTLEITGISLLPGVTKGFAAACIESIIPDIQTRSFPEHGSVRYLNLAIKEFKNNSCVKKNIVDDKSSPFSYEGESIDIDWKGNISTDILSYSYYYFPFDKFAIAGKFDVNIQFRDDNGNPISKTQVISSQTIDYNIHGWESYTGVLTDAVESNKEWLIYERPLITRLSILGLIIILFFVAIVLPFINELSSKIEIAIAVFLGLISIRPSILPSDVPRITAIDTFLLVEMLLIICIVIAHPIFNFVIFGNVNSKSEIVNNLSESEAKTGKTRRRKVNR